MRIVVIIPTYNEAKAIKHVVDALEEEFNSIQNHEMQILIVDGNSTDGTVDIVRNLTTAYGNLHVISEVAKRGVGMAYLAGMKHAVEELCVDAFIEFDGDFQHNPKDVHRLVAELENGYDYIIGSRYIAGGAIPEHWGWHRKILSRFGSLVIKHLLDLPTNDNTSGLKLTRVKGFFDKLPLSEDAVLSKRHAYKIHLLYEMYTLGAKVKEIPIVFLERDGGESKSSFEDIAESLKVLCVLWLRRVKK